MANNIWHENPKESETFELEVQEGILYANTNIDEITRRRYFLLGLYEKETEEDIICVRHIPDSEESESLVGDQKRVKSLVQYRNEVSNTNGLPKRLREGLIGLLEIIEQA